MRYVWFVFLGQVLGLIFAKHAVDAAGIRRYALTCRYIRPEMMADEERREKARVNGHVPERWQADAYKGEST